MGAYFNSTLSQFKCCFTSVPISDLTASEAFCEAFHTMSFRMMCKYLVRLQPAVTQGLVSVVRDHGFIHNGTVIEREKKTNKHKCEFAGPCRGLHPQVVDDDEDVSLFDLMRDALAAEEKIDADLRAQEIAAEERNEMLQKQKAADAEEKKIDTKLREELLAAKKRLEAKERQDSPVALESREYGKAEG
ncbi:hypothetical protein B0H17DRAFT_1128722 [Mycena rosella]|uniref:Uncharacterized protein n=1 Tax=Mycena rosella TaxID=1033263 RepID=A0AAD7DY11_MYCRO|nr:hypothetical protein B0H17DRAFT_1128722 [Mycena rosella]